MPLYVNPNAHPVTVDLGNPSRRHVTLEPFGRAAAPGVHRVLLLDHRKAGPFVQINMLALAPDAVKEADVDGVAIEAAATESARNRFNRTPSPDAAQASRDRREKAEAAFRLQESKALNAQREREAARAAKAPAIAAAEDRAKGIVTKQPEPTRLTDPDAETSTDLEPVLDESDAINKDAELKPGDARPVLGKESDAAGEGEQGHNTED